MYEFVKLQGGGVNDSYSEWVHSGSTTSLAGSYALGNDADSNDVNFKAAIRFPSVAISGSIYLAKLYMYAQFAEGTARIESIAWGIKETNTASFSSNPFGRTKTTANAGYDIGTPGSNGQYFGAMDVTAQVNEILAQGGWASGNAMGFIIQNNSTNDSSIEDDTSSARLFIQTSAPPNFTPTPITVSAPSLPAASDFGLRVSAPGVDVRTASESQLFFTSRKKELRVNEEHILTNTTQFAHGLGYAPAVLGYYTDSGKIRIANVPSNIFSVEPYVGSDDTNVYAPATVVGNPSYVYVFIDPLT